MYVRTDKHGRAKGANFKLLANANGHALSTVWRLWQRTAKSDFSISFTTELLNSQQVSRCCRQMAVVLITAQSTASSAVNALHSYPATAFVCHTALKGRVVPVHAMRTSVGGLHLFLASVLDGREWSGSRPVRFTLKERNPCTHWIRGWVETRAGLDVWRRHKLLSHVGIRPETVNLWPNCSIDYAILCCRSPNCRKL